METEVEQRVIFVRCDPALHELVERVAQIEDRTMAAVVRQALFVYFQHQGLFEAQELEDARNVHTTSDDEGLRGDSEWPDWMQE